MASPNYSIPEWILHPGADIAATALRARQVRSEEASRKQQAATQGAELDIAKEREGMLKDEHEAKVKAIAAKTAADKDFQDAFGKLDPKDPNYNKDLTRLIIQHGTAISDLRGVGPTLSALRQSDVKSGFQPFGEPDSETTPPGATPGPSAPPAATSGAPSPAAPTPTSGAMPPTSIAPPAQAKASPWLQKPGVFTDSRGTPHVIHGTPAPRPAPPRATALKPGEIGYLDGKPYATNTLPIPPKYGVVNPGGMTTSNGIPISTNTIPRTSGPGRLPPNANGSSVDKAMSLSGLKKTDMVDRNYYRFQNGKVGQWDKDPGAFIMQDSQ